jgi:hypothetical protein
MGVRVGRGVIVGVSVGVSVGVEVGVEVGLGVIDGVGEEVSDGEAVAAGADGPAHATRAGIKTNTKNRFKMRFMLHSPFFEYGTGTGLLRASSGCPCRLELETVEGELRLK